MNDGGGPRLVALGVLLACTVLTGPVLGVPVGGLARKRAVVSKAPTEGELEGGCSMGDLNVLELSDFVDRAAGKRTGAGVSARDVLNHITRSLPLVKFGNVHTTPLAHVDGRTSAPVMAVGGGEPGHVVLALAAWEMTEKRQLGEVEVSAVLSDYILMSDRSQFSFNVDTQVLDNLCTTVKLCMPRDSLVTPPPQMLTTLRTELVKPENQGNGFFRQLLLNSNAMGVRVGLTRTFIVALYNLLWGVPRNHVGTAAMQLIQSRLRLVVMEGGHNEQALVHVRTPHCASTAIPMLVPEFNGLSLFLEYDDVEAFNRLDARDAVVGCALKWSTALAQSPTTAYKVMAQAMDALATQQRRAIIAADRGATPVFSVEWPASCCQSSMSSGNLTSPVWHAGVGI